MDEIVAMSEQLSKGIPYVRVDRYIIDDKPYFDEFTFFTWAGFLRFAPKEWDKKMANALQYRIVRLYK